MIHISAMVDSEMQAMVIALLNHEIISGVQTMFTISEI
jgi:hypothetical protein